MRYRLSSGSMTFQNEPGSPAYGPKTVRSGLRQRRRSCAAGRISPGYPDDRASGLSHHVSISIFTLRIKGRRSLGYLASVPATCTGTGTAGPLTRTTSSWTTRRAAASVSSMLQGGAASHSNDARIATDVACRHSHVESELHRVPARKTITGECRSHCVEPLARIVNVPDHPADPNDEGRCVSTR